MPQRDPEVPAWIDWPVRAVAVLVVVPVLLLREVLVTAEGALRRYVARPLARFGYLAVVRPISWLWRQMPRVGRFLRRYLARPVARLVRSAVWLPLTWLTITLVVAPARCVGHALALVWQALTHWTLHALRPVGQALARWARHALRPVRHALVRAWHAAARAAGRFGGAVAATARTLVHGLLIPAMSGAGRLWGRVTTGTRRAVAGAARAALAALDWLTTYLVMRPVYWLADALTPLARVVGRAIVQSWRVVDRTTDWLGRALVAAGRLLHRFVLRPFGLMAAWLWRWTLVLGYRWLLTAWRRTVKPAARWVRHDVLAPAGRWLHTCVLRPTAATSRAVLAAVGLPRRRRRPAISRAPERLR